MAEKTNIQTFRGFFCARTVIYKLKRGGDVNVLKLPVIKVVVASGFKDETR